MNGDLLTIIDASEMLDARVFSLVRLKILWALSELGDDGATARQIRTGLRIGSEGTTYSNLNTLVEMGYLRKEMVTFESREIELYVITYEGLEEWQKIRMWCSMRTNGGA